MDFSPRDFLNKHHESISGLLQSQSELAFNDKSLAHGRIMQLIISLTTLSLTGWIGLVTWKFSSGSAEWWRPISACIFLITAVLLSAISDFFVILTSKYVGEFIEAEKGSWFPSYNTLETKLLMMTLSGRPEPEKVQQAIAEHLSEIQKPSDTVEKQTKRIRRFHKFSWIIGVVGFLLFISAIFFSTYQMPMFVGTANSPKTSIRPNVSNSGICDLKEEH